MHAIAVIAGSLCPMEGREGNIVRVEHNFARGSSGSHHASPPSADVLRSPPTGAGSSLFLNDVHRLMNLAIRRDATPLNPLAATMKF